jgi:hypothetical protein
VVQHIAKEGKQYPLGLFVILVPDPSQVETQIDQAIEKTLADLVEKELDKYIPKEIREKADGQPLDIQRLYTQIHNTLSIPHSHARPQIDE